MADKSPFFFKLAPGMRQRFGGGRFAPPGTLSSAQNVRFRRDRVEKRGGTEAVATSPSHNQANWMADGLVSLDDTLYAVSTDRADFKAVGAESPITPIRRFAAAFSEDDSVYHSTIVQFGNSILVAASTEEVASASSQINLYSYTREGVLRQRRFILPGAEPRLIVSETGTACYIIYQTNAAGMLAIATITEDLVVGTPTTMANSTTHAASIVAGASPDAIVVAHHAGGDITLRRFEGVTQTHTATIVSAGTFRVGVDSGSGGVVSAYINNTGVQFSRHSNASLTVQQAPTTIESATASITQPGPVVIYARDATNSTIAWTRRDDGTAPTSQIFSLNVAQVTQAGLVWGNVVPTPDWQVVSDFFPATGVSGASLYLLASTRTGRVGILKHEAGPNVGADECQIVATVFDRDTFEGSNSSRQVYPVLDLDSSRTPREIYVNVPWATRPPSGNRAADVYVCSERGGNITLSSGRWRQALRLGPSTYIAGGGCICEPRPMTSVAGSATANYGQAEGFTSIPTAYSVAVAGAGLTSGETYSYRVVYEHINERGERVRSEPSPAVTAAPTGADLAATLRIQVPGGTWRSEAVAHVYRSWDGGPYYRITPDAGAPLLTQDYGGSVGRSIDYTDTMTDAQAATKERLYTDLGYLPNASMTGGRVSCEGGGRLFSVDNLDRIRFTKIYVPGEPAQFVDDPTFLIVPPVRPTALAYLDGTLVIFSERAIHLVNGDGPDDRGAGFFSEPRALPHDDGCIEPRSVLVTSAGVVYQSGRGLMLLPRGFGPPVWIGEDVQELLRTYPVIQGACRSSAQGSELAHWLLCPAEATGYGAVLVLDVLKGAWSFDRFTAANENTVDCIGPWFGNLGFNYRGSGGAQIRNVDDSGSSDYVDLDSSGNPIWITSTIQLAELRPFGEIGHGVVTELVVVGEYRDDCTVSIITSLDEGLYLFDGSQPETRTWALPADISSTTTGAALYLYATVTHGNGTALRVTLTDGSPGGSPGWNGAVAWYAIGIDARPDGGIRRALTGERK